MPKKIKKRFRKGIRILAIITMFILTIKGALASNITSYEIEETTFNSIINITITNSTISIKTEGEDVSYPNTAGFNYSHSFNIIRNINITKYNFNTLSTDSNLTCPAYNVNLTCPSLEIDENNITDYITQYITENLEPSQEEIEECEEKIDECSNNYLSLKDNSSVCYSKINQYSAEVDRWQEMYKQEKDSRTVWYIMTGFLIVLLALVLMFNIKGGQLPFVWKPKPTNTRIGL